MESIDRLIEAGIFEPNEEFRERNYSIRNIKRGDLVMFESFGQHKFLARLRPEFLEGECLFRTPYLVLSVSDGGKSVVLCPLHTGEHNREWRKNALKLKELM